MGRGGGGGVGIVVWEGRVSKEEGGGGVGK